MPKIDDDLKYHSEIQRHNAEMRWGCAALHCMMSCWWTSLYFQLLSSDVMWLLFILWYCCWCTPRNVTRKVQGGRKDIIKDCILTAYCVVGCICVSSTISSAFQFFFNYFCHIPSWDADTFPSIVLNSCNYLQLLSSPCLKWDLHYPLPKHSTGFHWMHVSMFAFAKNDNYHSYSPRISAHLKYTNTSAYNSRQYRSFAFSILFH